MTKGKRTRAKENTKQDQRAPTKANASDDRDDKVKTLQGLNQDFATMITDERNKVADLKNMLQKSDDACKRLLVKMKTDKSQWDSCEEAMKRKIEDLKNELAQTRESSEYHEKLCIHLVTEKDELENKLKTYNDVNNEMQCLNNELQCLNNELAQTRRCNDSNEKLCTQLAQEKNELENRLKECNEEIQKLQSVKHDLNQASLLCENYELLCSQLEEEKNESENMVKECNKKIEELHEKMKEDRCLFDACKADMQTEAVKIHNELDSAVDEKNLLNKKYEELCAKHTNEKNELKKCNESAKKLKEKMAEDQKLWDACKVNFEKKITEQRNEIEEARKLNKTHEELCTQLMQENITMENDLEKINDSSMKLIAKMTEDKKMWDSYLKKLESRVAGLQNEVIETKVLSQGHEELCAKLRREKNDMENKLKEFSDKIKELQNEKRHLEEKLKESDNQNKRLHLKMAINGFNGGLWEISKREFEDKVAKLENEVKEARMLSQGQDNLLSQSSQEKNELGKKVKQYNDMIKELQGKMDEDKCLWDACKADMQGQIVKVKSELDSAVNERNLLNKKYEELCAKHTNDKNDLKECNESVKKLKEKMANDQKLWDSSKVDLERKITKQQDEIHEARKLSKKHEELSTQLMEGKIKMEKDLEKINDSSEKLNAKMTEDKKMWDSYMTKLEVRVAGLQNEVNETKVSRQGHEEVCTKLRQEKHDMENKLKELNDKNKELQDEKKHLEKNLKEFDDETKRLQIKIAFDRGLWEICKGELSQSHELRTKLRLEKHDMENKLKEFNDKNKELQNEKRHLEEKLKESDNETKRLHLKMASNGFNGGLWEVCKGKFEDKIVELEDEVKESRMLSQEYDNLLIQSSQEKNELEKKVKQYNDMIKELQGKMDEDKSLWDSCKADMQRQILNLQDELQKTGNLCQKHENLCTELKKENGELENKLKQSNVETEKLNTKFIEDGHFWNLSKAELEGTIAGLQNELDETRLRHEEFSIQLTDEKKLLEKKLKEFDDETKEFKEKISECKCSWDSSKAGLEGVIAELQNELNAARLKLKEYHNSLRDETKHTEEKLKGFCHKNNELQSELMKTKKMCQNLENKCIVVREQKGGLRKNLKDCNNQIEELNAKLKKCNNQIEELNAKLKLSDTCKENLEGKVAGLLYEKRIMSQEHDELCNHLRDENSMLEHKLNEFNERYNKLQAQMNEDLLLWESCKAEFTTRVSVLQNEIDQVKCKEIVKQREDAMRDSFASHKALRPNLTSHILLDSQCRESKCNIILPHNGLFSGCPYGWCGGIV